MKEENRTIAESSFSGLELWTVNQLFLFPCLQLKKRPETGKHGSRSYRTIDPEGVRKLIFHEDKKIIILMPVEISFLFFLFNSYNCNLYHTPKKR